MKNLIMFRTSWRRKLRRLLHSLLWPAETVPHWCPN
jgi:hypothetical protein